MRRKDDEIRVVGPLKYVEVALEVACEVPGLRRDLRETDSHAVILAAAQEEMEAGGALEILTDARILAARTLREQGSI